MSKLLIGALALLSSFSITAQAAEDKRVLLKTAVYVPLAIRGLGTIPTWLSEHLDKTSNGSIKMKLYGPGKLAPANEIFDAVHRGQIQAGYTTAGNQSGVLGNKAAFFSSVPFGPNSSEYLAWLYYGGGRELWTQLYEDNNFNVHSIPCGLLAPETSGWFNKSIDKPEDLQGLRMRFFGLGGLVMEKMGVSTSQIPGAEIFPALEKGAIEATEFSMPAIDEMLGFHKILKYNYFPGWHQPSTILELVVNKDVWNKKLSGSQQAQIEMGCRGAMLDSLAFSDAIQLPVMKKNIEERGVENRYWSAEMLAAFKEKWHEVVAEESAKDPEFKAIWEQLSAFRKDYQTWDRWAFLPRPGTVRAEQP